MMFWSIYFQDEEKVWASIKHLVSLWENVHTAGLLCDKWHSSYLPASPCRLEAKQTDIAINGALKVNAPAHPFRITVNLSHRPKQLFIYCHIPGAIWDDVVLGFLAAAQVCSRELSTLWNDTHDLMVHCCLSVKTNSACSACSQTLREDRARCCTVYVNDANIYSWSTFSHFFYHLKDRWSLFIKDLFMW